LIGFNRSGLAHSKAHQFGRGMQTQLLHDFAAIGIHGLSAQVQRRGDFASRRLTSCSLASARWADALNTHGAERGTGARRPRSGMITECNRFVPIEALFEG